VSGREVSIAEDHYVSSDSITQGSPLGIGRHRDHFQHEPGKTRDIQNFAHSTKVICAVEISMHTNKID
jgi:hypothetical protein